MNHPKDDVIRASDEPRFGSLRVALKVGAILGVSVVLVPPQWLLMRFSRGPISFVLPRLWFVCLRKVMRIDVDVVGEPRRGGGTVFVGNHVSHFDIVLLGSLLPARFIAKDDMERWPGMRFLGELAQTLFISRQRRDAASVAAALATKLRPDHDVVLFPEGTTSSGQTVAPFKSSLFALFLSDAASTRAWTLQPFTLDVRATAGRALSNGGDRDIYAFHGGMDAGTHVKRFLRLSGATVRVVFHRPLVVPPGADRKRIAMLLQETVASGLRS